MSCWHVEPRWGVRDGRHKLLHKLDLLVAEHDVVDEFKDEEPGIEEHDILDVAAETQPRPDTRQSPVCLPPETLVADGPGRASVARIDHVRTLHRERLGEELGLEDQLLHDGRVVHRRLALGCRRRRWPQTLQTPQQVAGLCQAPPRVPNPHHVHDQVDGQPEHLLHGRSVEEWIPQPQRLLCLRGQE